MLQIRKGLSSKRGVVGHVQFYCPSRYQFVELQNACFDGRAPRRALLRNTHAGNDLVLRCAVR
jgi:hypothetical protein